MITDYSSACWDVYYQEKPILFYHFDNDLHEQARGSYIDMEHELFGDRCMTEEQLVACIREYIETDSGKSPLRQYAKKIFCIPRPQ